jgi:deoxyguanosine kinase
MEEKNAYIGLGSNLGDRGKYIKSALKLLKENEHIKVVRVSDIIETIPLAGTNQPKYLNAVVEVNTTLNTEDLHKKLIDIESSIGRVRQTSASSVEPKKWASRTIDLDLLLFGTNVINLPHLIVPHPQMHLRSFVLKGLCQLNANLIHPLIKVPVSELAARLVGCDFFLDSRRPQLISIAGIIGVGKTTLAEKLAKQLGCKILLEPYDMNPFMPEVYAGKTELALDSQLYFLTGRVQQLNSGALIPGKLVVNDYIFNKELIYAKLLLNSEQLSLYESIHEPFAKMVAEPVLVIYLQDSANNCLERIHRRNRPYEQQIGLQFLQTLSAEYKRLFANWKISPLVRLSISEFDCTRNDDVQFLVEQIRYYVTTPSAICEKSKLHRV